MKYETEKGKWRTCKRNRDNDTTSTINLFGDTKYGEEMTLVKITRENLKTISQDITIWT